MIYDGPFYGIFGDETNKLIALVQQHHALAEIEAFPCPKCKAPMKVGFDPDGKGFVIQCMGAPLHMTQYQQIALPPKWWSERTIEVTPCLES